MWYAIISHRGLISVQFASVWKASLLRNRAMVDTQRASSKGFRTETHGSAQVLSEKLNRNGCDLACNLVGEYHAALERDRVMCRNNHSLVVCSRPGQLQTHSIASYVMVRRSGLAGPSDRFGRNGHRTAISGLARPACAATTLLLSTFIHFSELQRSRRKWIGTRRDPARLD